MALLLEKPHRSIKSRMVARDFLNVIPWLDLAAAAMANSTPLPSASLISNWKDATASEDGVALMIASKKTRPTTFDAFIAAFLRLATAFSGSIGFNSADQFHYPILNIWAGVRDGKQVRPHFNIDRIIMNCKAGMEVEELGDYHDRRASNLRQKAVDISVGRGSKYQSNRSDVINNILMAYDYAKDRGKAVYLTRDAYEHYLRFSLKCADEAEAIRVARSC